MYLKNERGLTLIEILATLVILSIMTAVMAGIHYSGQNQYVAQNKQINTQSDARNAVKTITELIRNGDNILYDPTSKQLQIDSETLSFDSSAGVITLGQGEIIASNISAFNVETDFEGEGTTGDQITIAINDLEDEQGSSSYSTVLYLR